MITVILFFFQWSTELTTFYLLLLLLLIVFFRLIVISSCHLILGSISLYFRPCSLCLGVGIIFSLVVIHHKIKHLCSNSQIRPCSTSEPFSNKITILSSYVYHFSTVIDFSSEKYSGSTGHRKSWYQ